MEKQAKLITVYPVMAGNGAKYIATNLANTLQLEHPKKKVALVDFNLKHPYLAHALTEHDEIHGIDNLMEKIDGKTLTHQLFQENMISMKNNVELLKGTKLLGRYKAFTAEHMNVIVECLRDIYDYVVIATAPEADNAGTVYGINEADEIVMVVRNTIANRKKCDSAVSMLNTYKKSDTPIKVLYNQFSASSKVDLGKMIGDYGLEVLGMCDYDETTLDNGNLIHGSKGFFKTKNKNQELYNKIVKTI